MMLLPVPLDLFSKKALAASGTSGKRQHLITMIDFGGWDTTWYYNFVDPAIWNSGRNDGNTGLNAETVAQKRYTTSPRSFAGQPLAPGMQFWTDTDLSRTMIWKAGAKIAEHGFNQFMYGGGTSNYAVSYSSLISAYQAQTRGQSTLHYVKLALGPRDIFTSPGMMTGAAVPTCFNSHASWLSLTGGSNAAVAPSVLQQQMSVESTIALLGKDSQNRVTRASTQGLLGGFSNSFSSAATLNSSHYAGSAEFQAFWLRYYNAIKTEAVNQTASGYGANGDYSGGIVGALAGLVASNPQTSDDLVTLIASQDNVIASAALVSWQGALSAFLIIHDLSAVIDFNPSSGDGHQFIATDYIARFAGFTVFRELTRHLSEIPNPEVSGQTLLDCTLINYMSEFDRTATFYPFKNNFGTSHSESFSLMMAGHHCNRGHIVGNYAKASGQMGPPTPVNPTTGAPDGNGYVLSPFSIHPSIMAMFGAPTPNQQITEFKAIPALIAPAFRS